MRLRACIASLAFVLGVESTAFADAEEDARQAVRKGLTEFARGETAAALADFQAASRLVPEANLPYRYAAEALAALGRYEEAIASYEKYLELKPDVSDADMVRARIAEVKKKLVGEVTVQSHPASAAVFVDNAAQPAGKTPVTSLVLPHGPHVFVLKLEGHRDARVEGNVVGGGHITVDANLVSTDADDTDGAKSRSSWTRRKTGFVVAGIGAAILGTGLVLDATWVSGRVNAFEDARSNDAADVARARQDEAHTAQVATAITMGTGALVLVVGAVLALWPSSSSSAGNARTARSEVICSRLLWPPSPCSPLSP